jgi:hypothetical protein
MVKAICTYRGKSKKTMSTNFPLNSLNCPDDDGKKHQLIKQRDTEVNLKKGKKFPSSSGQFRLFRGEMVHRGAKIHI